MWNRTNDPHNSEELMIAEYYRRVDENKGLVALLETTKAQADQTQEELLELLRKEEEKNKHLQSVLDKEEGIVDLHAPIILYKANVASSYYFKDWLNKHANDVGAGAGLNGFIAALEAEDKECIKWFKDLEISYTHLVTVSKHEFRFTIQIPYFGTFAYDPEYNRTSLFEIKETFSDGQWVKVPLEEMQCNVAAKIRENANKAYNEYKEELTKDED